MKTELLRILNLGMWLRIIAIVILLTALLAYGLKRIIPDLEFDWVRAMAASIGICILMLAVMTVALWFGAPTITINDKGVSRGGQAVHWRYRSDIRRITIDVTDATRSWLRVESSHQPFEAGIGDEVNLADLKDFLRQTFPELVVEERR